MSKQFKHPEVIEEILKSAPGNSQMILRAYLHLLVTLLDEHRSAIKRVIHQRDQVVDFVDELMVDLRGAIASDEDKAATANTMKDLMAKLTKEKS